MPATLRGVIPEDFQILMSLLVIYPPSTVPPMVRFWPLGAIVLFLLLVECLFFVPKKESHSDDVSFPVEKRNGASIQFACGVNSVKV